MHGTAKQIAWAEQIKQDFEAALWAEVEEANEQVIAGVFPPIWAAAIYDATVLLRNTMDGDIRGRAWIWIEQRHRIMGFPKGIKALARTKTGPAAAARYGGPPTLPDALEEWRKILAHMVNSARFS